MSVVWCHQDICAGTDATKISVSVVWCHQDICAGSVMSPRYLCRYWCHQDICVGSVMSPRYLQGISYILSTTNKMQCYIIFFIIVYALHVSGGLSAHHQALKNCTHSIGYMPGLLATTASSSSKQAWHIPDAVCTVLELLMMGGETAQKM